MNMRRAYLPVILLLAACLGAGPAMAGKIYQTKDAQGNTEFSDSASQNAKQVELQNPQTYDGSRYAKEYERATPPEPKPIHTGPPFTVMKITYPKNQTSIRSNPGTLQITFQVSPARKPGYQIELVMDGKPLESVSGGSVALNNVDRGTHTVQIQAVDMDTGQTVQSSDPVTFTLHRHSILQKKPKI